MKTTKVTYESGATSHAVNNLILFADNTRYTSERRDEIYRKYVNPSKKLINWRESMKCEFLKSFHPMCAHQYDKEFNYEGNERITQMSAEECDEFAELYANDFENWKQDHI